MEKKAEPNAIREIRASEVTIEVTDKATGQTFRRTLPIDYVETANALRLMAENASGQPSELVFFTTEGQRHLLDMVGAGADQDPCGGHGRHQD